MGEWLKFPTTYEKLQETFRRIGIGQEDDFGCVYEEWFITDYDCYVDGLYDKLGEYANLDELNFLASKLDEMSQSDYDRFVAAMGMGEYTGSMKDMINLCDNLDIYEVYPDVHDDDDLGRLYIDEYGSMSVPEHLKNYIDYEAYGRDVRFEEGGEYTDAGYVYSSGSSFHEYYDGDRESIPEEYRIMSSPDGDELEQSESTEEMAMGIAHDLDEYFRQKDPQYAADHTDAQLAVSEIYGKLMDGRIAATEDILHSLGVDAVDTFAARLEAFKEASGYEEWLDFDPAAIREALENPDKSHIDAMLAAAVKAEQDYVATINSPAPQQLPPDALVTGEIATTPRGSFYVTDMTREQMEAAGYGLHHQSEDGKYLIMGNGARAFAVSAEPVAEKENPLRTAEMTVEDDYGMIDGVINNGRRDEAAPKTSIRGRLEDARRECAERKPPEKKNPGRTTPEHDAL